jgi:hypothetical protein
MQSATRLSGHRDLARPLRVLVLAMAPARPRQLPTSFFEKAYNLACLHADKFLPDAPVVSCPGAPPPGFEPGTLGLEVRCSIQLSYGGSVSVYVTPRAGFARARETRWLQPQASRRRESSRPWSASEPAPLCALSESRLTTAPTRQCQVLKQSSGEVCKSWGYEPSGARVGSDPQAASRTGAR